MKPILFNTLLFCLFGPVALAMPPAQQGQQQGPNLMWPLILSFAVIYFLVLRPQQRREKDRQDSLKSIEKGDEVITKGGIIGKVTNVAEKVLTIEIADRTRVKISRDFVFSVEKGS